MKIGKRFNQLTEQEYRYYIDHSGKYTDFNTLGLYRSIIENEKLNLQQKLEIRDYANHKFGKTFEFYQLQYPSLYFDLITLGESLTTGDYMKLWDEIRHNQERILKAKRIKHRNFGDYSKHNCGHDWCPYNGVMTRKGSRIAEMAMRFHSDRSKHGRRSKRAQQKKEEKHGQYLQEDDA